MGISTSFPIVQLPRERVVIVTGANSGIGYEIAKWTAMMGATVVMACRSEERAKEAIRRMNAEFNSEKSKGTPNLLEENELALEFMELRLDSFTSVMKFVEAFKTSGRQLHVLFCNAGIALGPYRQTEDGLESVLQVNYLSHFLIISKFLPIMKQSGPNCRILFMSSIYHNWCTFNVDRMNYTGTPEGYSAGEFYGRSKMYQIMQMYSLHRRLKGSNITVNSIHPGAVNTNIATDPDTCFLRIFVFMFKTFGITAERAARCSINCTTNPRLSNTSGIYFVDFTRTTPSSQSRNERYQELLWNKSIEYLKDYITQDEISCMEGNQEIQPPTNGIQNL